LFTYFFENKNGRPILAANNTKMDKDGFNYATRFLKCGGEQV
jgi:hypothetical protein